MDQCGPSSNSAWRSCAAACRRRRFSIQAVSTRVVDRTFVARSAARWIGFMPDDRRRRASSPAPPLATRSATVRRNSGGVVAILSLPCSMHKLVPLTVDVADLRRHPPQPIHAIGHRQRPSDAQVVAAAIAAASCDYDHRRLSRTCTNILAVDSPASTSPAAGRCRRSIPVLGVRWPDFLSLTR